VIATRNECLGVLRVKNKCQEGALQHFTIIDIVVLENLCSAVAFTYRNALVLAHEHEETARRKREYDELAQFLKTVRHEVTSPLTVVSQAPDVVLRVLQDEKLCDEVHLPKRLANLFSDMTMIANRLVFISQTFTFDAAQVVKDITVRQALQDAVAPVLAFAVPFALKRQKTIKVDKESLLRRIVCDSVSAAMAFHVLIDNAIKYSERGAVINVSGSRVGDVLHIVVVNPNPQFRITPTDMNNLFTKYYRGEIPRAQNVEGSGIGLSLAREIMQRNQGTIKLSQTADAVRAELVFRLDRSEL
jgi:K+-sensing histidine kinase KdpD